MVTLALRFRAEQAIVSYDVLLFFARLPYHDDIEVPGYKRLTLKA